jgi:hypothetical protein
LLEDKLAEIAVGDDQNPFLFPGYFKDILIGKTWGIVTRDDLNVMSELAKVRNKFEVGTLVEQEFHRAASARPSLNGFGETSSPVTISLSVREARLHVRPGQIRMGSEQLADIRIMGELLQHQVHGDARPLDNRLSRQNPWVSNDSFPVKSLIFLHNIINHYSIPRQLTDSCSLSTIF